MRYLTFRDLKTNIEYKVDVAKFLFVPRQGESFLVWTVDLKMISGSVLNLYHVHDTIIVGYTPKTYN